MVNNENMFEKSREHLANERTFLAWIRTSIALMGFGFVIVKFAFFLKQISLLVNIKEVPSNGYSSAIGIVMIALGVAVALLAFIQYERYKKQLSQNQYYSSSLLLLFITLMLIAGGLILIFYIISIHGYLTKA